MQLIRPLQAFLAAVVVAVLAPLLTQPSSAQPAATALVGDTPTTTTIAGTSTYAGSTTTLTVGLHDAGGGLEAQPVLVERRVDGTWQAVGTVLTGPDGTGTTTATMSRLAADNVFRATYAGDPTYAGSTSGPVRVPLVRRVSTITLSGPHRVVDEKSVTLRVLWRTGNGQPVSGPVVLYRRVGDRWAKSRTLRTGSDGRVSVTLKPRSDSRWKVRGTTLDWVKGDDSPGFFIDNLPPGIPVTLPKAAPKPRIKLPKQAHAVGSGANPAITRIPNGVWNQMTGVTWHRGCPVGRAGLRLLRINYWDYQGYRRRGEIVIASGAASRVSAAFSEMYRAKLPIRSMYRVDRFGWSSRVRGGNDYRSMAAGNTSGFNCRDVVGRPGVRSPHSYGRSIDVNTWENPYRSRQGTVPNTWWMSHSHKRVAWRSRDHAVVRLMARHGLRWTYGNGDTQHFDATSGSNGRVVMAPGCMLPTFIACD